MKKIKTILMLTTLFFAATISLTSLQAFSAQNQELPPGISNKEEVPGKGQHKGWWQGKHKGWDKQKSEGAEELSRDKKEIRKDTREIKGDRKDLRKAVKSGDEGNIEAERKGLRKDITERKQDKKELHKDKKHNTPFGSKGKK